MDTVLQFLIYSLISGVFLSISLALLFSVSISVLGMLFIFASLLLLTALLISTPFIFMLFLMIAPFTYLASYYPSCNLWLRKNILEKPKHLFHQYYLQPLYTLPTQTISSNVYYFILASVSAATVAMLLLTYGVLHNSSITQWNNPLYYAMREVRSPSFDPFWTKISLLNSFSMSVLWGMITLYFIAKRDTWRATHWILLGIFVGGITGGLKYCTAMPRPGAVFPIKDAFPSAHVSTHMTLLGGLIMLADLHRGTKRWARLLTYAFYGIWVYLIAFSRLYFAAHWATDIVGGVLISLISLGLFSLSYYRRVAPPFIHRELRLVSLSSLSGIWLMRFILEYDRILKFYMASF